MKKNMFTLKRNQLDTIFKKILEDRFIICFKENTQKRKRGHFTWF